MAYGNLVTMMMESKRQDNQEKGRRLEAQNRRQGLIAHLYCKHNTIQYEVIYKHCKGKAVPLQAWSGPEGSRKLRFPDFMTKAQNGGKVVSLTHRPPLPPGNTPGTHFC